MVVSHALQMIFLVSKYLYSPTSFIFCYKVAYDCKNSFKVNANANSIATANRSHAPASARMPVH